jgi:glycosyltransferase involved in cell wall biosynthesis
MPNKNKKKNKQLPFVSICTPTFNRRPFIEHTIKYYLSQDYPKDKMEWIIIDDGSDTIEDLVSDIPGVKYFKYDTKMTLGKKRNVMHEKSKGDIIVYMDDDDYYPPCRVSHAVDKLTKNKTALCAGSSEIYIYFNNIGELWQMGPYSKNHSTAGTFAFKRELLEITSYDETACLAEEKHFLKNYTIPFVQLDPLKTILVFAHSQNTFDKKKLLLNGENKFQKKSRKTIDMFIKDSNVKDFYLNRLELLLINYSDGDPSMKPDVIKQLEEITNERKIQASKNVTIQRPGQEAITLTTNEVISLLQSQQQEIVKLRNPTITLQQPNGNTKQFSINELVMNIRDKEKTNNILKQNNNTLKTNYNELETKYNELETKYNELETKYNELETKYNE